MAAPLEVKVVASTTIAFVVSVLIAVLNLVAADATLLGSLPAWAQTVLIALVPALGVFGAGYGAAHTSRPDDGGEDDPGDHAAGPDRPPFRPDAA